VTYDDDYKTKPEDTESTSVDYFAVDDHYLAALGITLIAGRNFDSTGPEHNKNSILLNEEAVKNFHFATPQDAVGEFIYKTGDSSRAEIIGVVKNYNHQMMVLGLRPMVLRCDTAEQHMVHVKYTGHYDDAVKSIAAAWARVNPSRKIAYTDFKQEVQEFYQLLFGDFVSIVGVIAFIAIVISCLGLLGMATYTIETRLKEISIRKVLGSGNLSLMVLLSKSFIYLLLLAIVLATPIAWFLNSQWLQLIAYRTDFGVGVIGFSVSVVVLLGGLTIGSQTIRAIRIAPLKNLGRE
jgi:putative ABC transport system permease protein